MKEIIRVEGKGKAAVFFDTYNSRCRVDDYSGNFKVLAERLIEECESRKVNKLIWKVKASDCLKAFETGMHAEGADPFYFRGETCWFFAMFFSEERRKTTRWKEEDRILRDACTLFTGESDSGLDARVRAALPEDAVTLSSFYKKMFTLYPVPIADPDYILHSMEEGTVYMIVEEKGETVSAASAETDFVNRNAEISDCATLPGYRNQGLLKQLITALEKELAGMEIYSAYSLSRAGSFGMNRSLYQSGYMYGGRLLNNCYIGDGLENMNLWYKDLSK
ncbi:putative beta-lysine N-acetyltransferase [Bacillus mangrovi]|uniref:Putative beta-lysine N-acetyltransferase n=1 Tax=Metabacillus mangrovi TaxID=1491830 RepID=A0A7X2S276_9BACI|nr:putative beta-lysine N-acetyltransferase [Metabacillus mangrovi]MTH52027.1 putative beta-lysine N-acetyltransferase [Metabacillus mangrovi]